MTIDWAPLPVMDDYEHLQEEVTPHPDGKPHIKACRQCAFRRSNPQGLTDADFAWIWLQREIGGFEFFCTHREEDGFHRECACWAALKAGRSR